MVFKNLCSLVLWMKALEVLIRLTHTCIIINAEQYLLCCRSADELCAEYAAAGASWRGAPQHQYTATIISYGSHTGAKPASPHLTDAGFSR